MNGLPRRVHLIGIGGIGLSAIARVLIGQGVVVTGSDQTTSELTRELEALGAKVAIGHRPQNLPNVDLVLVTSAAANDNPEVAEARRRGIPVVKRSDFFPNLTAGKETIAVAGTHGKTTTTGMIACVLVNAGLDPSVVVGGVIPELNGNARSGGGKHFVIEADEYDKAFLGLSPAIAVVTSIEMDHPDCYRDVDAVAGAFGEFMRRVPADGLVVGCGEGARVAQELERVRPAQVVRYGFGEENDWRASDLMVNDRGGTDFIVWAHGRKVGLFSLQIPGRHNVLNALGTVAVAANVGIESKIMVETLAAFRGAARRFEIKGEFGGVTIVDDYAHHPAEIKATLAAARLRFPGRSLWAIFQPHTFSRTRALLQEFAEAFGDADHVIVTEVYAARERDDGVTSGKQIVERMRHPDARFMRDLDESVGYVSENIKPGDVLITLGAGDVNRAGRQLGRVRGEQR